MNYNYLRYFSVLAQVEHYTLAAARLGISQPSLSSAIHHLEDELGGVRLFEKVGRNIRLTGEGRYYQEKVDAALQELNTASMTLRESKISAPVLIRLGVVSGTVSGTVSREIAAYLQQNERIRFQLTESSADELMNLVRQEKLDMAIVDTTDRDRTLHFRKLCRRNFCAALPVGHPLTQYTALTPQQLSHQTQIVGICVVADDCIQSREDVCFVPIENWHQALYMCILYDKWLEPPVWAFVEQLVSVIRKNNPDT